MVLLLILITFCCILSLTLLCCKFGIAENYAFFGVTFFLLKFGLCKKCDKSQVCSLRPGPGPGLCPSLGPGPGPGPNPHPAGGG